MMDERCGALSPRFERKAQIGREFPGMAPPNLYRDRYQCWRPPHDSDTFHQALHHDSWKDDDGSD